MSGQGGISGVALSHCLRLHFWDDDCNGTYHWYSSAQRSRIVISTWVDFLDLEYHKWQPHTGVRYPRWKN
jgi:hypothetical protein